VSHHATRYFPNRICCQALQHIECAILWNRCPSSSSYHPNTTNEKHDTTHCMPPDKKSTRTKGRSESESRYVQAWATIKLTNRTAQARLCTIHVMQRYSNSVQYMSCNGTVPVYSTCHATVQRKWAVHVMQRYSASVQYMSCNGTAPV